MSSLQQILNTITGHMSQPNMETYVTLAAALTVAIIGIWLVLRLARFISFIVVLCVVGAIAAGGMYVLMQFMSGPQILTP